jgi:hypothetical protein
MVVHNLTRRTYGLHLVVPGRLEQIRFSILIIVSWSYVGELPSYTVIVKGRPKLKATLINDKNTGNFRNYRSQSAHARIRANQNSDHGSDTYDNTIYKEISIIN